MKWISVKKQLPEDDTDVIVCDEGSVEQGFYNPVLDRWYSSETDINNRNYELKADTHWMPFPEAPKKTRG